jgi:chromosome segregation ATPase
MILAGMPSLFLLLSFETFMGQIKAGVRRAAVMSAIAALEQQRVDLAGFIEQELADFEKAAQEHQAEKARMDGKLLELREELAGLRKEKRAYTEAIQILAQRPDINGADLGRMLGRSESLGRKLKAELVSVNGNGH